MLQQLAKAEALLCSERSKRRGNSSEEFASFETSSTIDELSCHILSLSAPKNPFGFIQCFLILKYQSGKKKSMSNQKVVIKCDLSLTQ